MSNLPAKADESFPLITKEDVRKFFCAGASDSEVALFLKICELSHLNPFKREAYIVKYGTEPATIMTGYEVYLKRAEKSNKWNGFKVWTEGSGPAMVAKVEVYRKDWTHPLYHEVEYAEYVQTKRDGTPNRFWKEKPKTMLKKVAVSQGLRMAFPDEVGGLPYTEDEIDPANIIVDVRPVEPPIEMPRPKQDTARPATEEAQVVPEPTHTAQEAAKSILGASPVSLEDLAPSDADMVPAGYKLIESKFDSLCKNKDCGKEIKKGSEVIYSPKFGVRHRDCA